jgi:L-asparagine transporter-like permease
MIKVVVIVAFIIVGVWVDIHFAQRPVPRPG